MIIARNESPEEIWPAMHNGLAKFATILLASCLLFAGCGGRDAAGDAPADAPAGRPDDGPLVLAFMPEVPPYTYLDPVTGEPAGIDVEIVRAAAAKLGRELEIRILPFAEILSSVKNGDADFAAAAITILDGRRRNFDFSIPYAEEGCVFLYRAGEEPPTMIRAESLRVGVVDSMSSDVYLTRHGIDPFRYESLHDAEEDLRAGRLDAVFYDRPALATAAAASGGALAVTPLETREFYGIGVRKGRPDLLEAVNDAIRQRNGGTAQ